MAESKASLTVKKKKTIGAGQTLVADTLPLARFKGLDYSLRYEDNGETKHKAVKVLVQKSDTGLNDSVYSRIGNTLNIATNFIVTGPNLELQVINFETFAVNLTFTRTKL